jgi:hypothetical protein
MVRFNDRVARNKEPYVLPGTPTRSHINWLHIGMCFPLSQCVAMPAAMKVVRSCLTNSVDMVDTLKHEVGVLH